MAAETVIRAVDNVEVLDVRDLQLDHRAELKLADREYLVRRWAEDMESFANAWEFRGTNGTQLLGTPSAGSPAKLLDLFEVEVPDPEPESKPEPKPEKAAEVA